MFCGDSSGKVCKHWEGHRSSGRVDECVLHALLSMYRVYFEGGAERSRSA